MTEPGPSRRHVLVAAGLLTLSGCTTARDPEPPPVDPDVAIRAEVAADVRRLSGMYDEALAAHPALQAELAPLASETAAHLHAVAPSPATSSASPTTSETATDPPTTDAGTPSPFPSSAVPATPGATRQWLAAAEGSAADLRVRQIGGASPALARLVAAIGASEAAHAALLGGGR